ncbi:hypothetical protein FJ875_25305 [Salmonella enterica]|nr:hypothetical protein [Salmonella enterica]
MRARNINGKNRKKSTTGLILARCAQITKRTLVGAAVTLLVIQSSGGATYDRVSISKGGTARLKYGTGAAPDVDLVGRYLIYAVATGTDSTSGQPGKPVYHLHLCTGGVRGELDLGNTEKWLTFERYVTGGCVTKSSVLTNTTSVSGSDMSDATRVIKSVFGIEPASAGLQAVMQAALKHGNIYKDAFPDLSKIEAALPFSKYVHVTINGCGISKGLREPGSESVVRVDMDNAGAYYDDYPSNPPAVLEFTIDQITLSTMTDNK